MLVRRLSLIAVIGAALGVVASTWAQSSAPSAGSSLMERLQGQWEEYNRKGHGPGHPADRLVEYRKALGVARQALEREPASVAWLQALWVSCLGYGDALEMLGEKADALVSFREGNAVAERLATADPANATWQEATSIFRSRIAGALAHSGQAEEAVIAFREALAAQRDLTEAVPGDRRRRRDLMFALNNFGSAQLKQGNFTDAEALYREALAIAEEPDPTQNEASRQGYLLTMYEGVGAALLAQGQAQASLVYADKGVAIAELLARRDPESASRLYDLSNPQDLKGHALLHQGNLEQAAKSFRAALVARQRALALEPENPMWLAVISNSFGNLGRVLALQGHIDEARDSFRKGRDIVQGLGGSTDWYNEQLSKLN